MTGTTEASSGTHEAQMEDAYVHQVYEHIAPHFSSTRFAIWPKYGLCLLHHSPPDHTAFSALCLPQCLGELFSSQYLN